MHSESASARRLLLPHPACDRGAIAGISGFTVSARRASARRLELQYTLRADPGVLEVPRPRPPSRADGLWHHTCFELFVSRGAPDYREYNFSPSGAWAAYHFTNYRTGMTAIDESPPQAHWQADEGALELSVVLESEWFAGDTPGAGLRLGCSAVIENKSGALSYWALRHPSAKPDFHDANAFVVDPGSNRVG